jgi:hypothetical protein
MRKTILLVGDTVGREPAGTRWIADPLAALGFLPSARLLVLVVGGSFDADEAELLARSARRRFADLAIASVGARVSDATVFDDVASAVASAEAGLDEATEWAFPTTWSAPRVREWAERARTASYEAVLGVDSGAGARVVATRGDAFERGLRALHAWGAQNAEYAAQIDEIEGGVRDALDVLSTPAARSLWSSARKSAEDAE